MSDITDPPISDSGHIEDGVVPDVAPDIYDRMIGAPLNGFGDDIGGDEERVAPLNGFEDGFANGFGIDATERRNRGALQEGERTVVGRVGAPEGKEATSTTFRFWVPDEVSVETAQIVTTESVYNTSALLDGERVTYYALVKEVYRCSRRRDMGHEFDEFDGDLSDDPPYEAEGLTYADADILRAEPERSAPPRERSKVCLAGPDAATMAYGIDQVKPENRLVVGLIKNGGAAFAGPGSLDLDYLLGGNGGHLNVTGSAGRATKSSFLLQVVYTLLRHARALKEKTPNKPELPRPVPIIFNVKNFDLFYLDYASKRYEPAKHADEWRQIGVDDPQPFAGVRYFAPQQPKGTEAIQTGRPGNQGVSPYSWSLRNIIESGLFIYLFSADDVANDNFLNALYDIEEMLTYDVVGNDGTERRTLSVSMPPGSDKPIQTFADLRDWLKNGGTPPGSSNHAATMLKVRRRLQLLLHESQGVLRISDNDGFPLNVTKVDTSDPCVVDLSKLARAPHLQRFVVAAVLNQLVESRTGANAISGLCYLIVLDELNRFAPRGGRDPITKLVETVAAEMRSQGVILFGAQQQASLVSQRVIENSAVRALGQTGGVELQSDVWRTSLNDATRRRAEGLRPNEKLVLQSGFRQPLYLQVPLPVWAMRGGEADLAQGPSQVQDISSPNTPNNGAERNKAARGAEDMSGFGDIP